MNSKSESDESGGLSSSSSGRSESTCRARSDKTSNPESKYFENDDGVRKSSLKKIRKKKKDKTLVYRYYRF